MITRRRGRALEQVSEEQPVEVEVCDAQTFPGAEDLDAALELDQLLGDFKWTLDRDSPLFDVDLDRFNEPDSGRETSSPERGEPAPRRNGEARGPNKNAIAARLNRIKKKEYVSGLERTVSGLSGENGTLKRQNAELSRRVEELEAETRYLRAVLANDSTLAQLLARLGGANGLQLSPPWQFRGGDHDYALPRKRARAEDGGGVCLHVDRDHVSLEFCAKCSQRAKM